MRTFVVVRQNVSYKFLFDNNGFDIKIGDLLLVDTKYGLQTGFADEVDLTVSENAEKYFCNSFSTRSSDIKKVRAVISKEILDGLLEGKSITLIKSINIEGEKQDGTSKNL